MDKFKWLVPIIPFVTPVGHVNFECFLTSTCNMAEMKKNLPSVNMIVNLKMKMKPQNKPFYLILPSTLSKYELKLNSKGNVYKPFALFQSRRTSIPFTSFEAKLGKMARRNCSRKSIVLLETKEL